MKVLLAENAGFCFGVKLAVDSAIKTQNEYNKKIYTLGPLIHNSDVVNYLEENNIYAIDINNVDTLNKDDVILIRSHGVSKDVFDAAVRGDKLAQDIFEYTGRILGEALADFIAFSSPEAIILFGGLAKSGDYIMKPIRKAIDDNILKIYEGKTKLLISELKDADAAVLGASALGWEVRE